MAAYRLLVDVVQLGLLALFLVASFFLLRALGRMRQLMAAETVEWPVVRREQGRWFRATGLWLLAVGALVAYMGQWVSAIGPLGTGVMLIAGSKAMSLLR